MLRVTRATTYLVWWTHLLLCEPDPLLCFHKAAARNRDQKLSGFHWNCKTSVWEPCTPRCLLRNWYSAVPSPVCSWSGSSKAYVPSHPYFIPSGRTSVPAKYAQGSILTGLSVKIKGLHDVSVTFACKPTASFSIWRMVESKGIIACWANLLSTRNENSWNQCKMSCIIRKWGTRSGNESYGCLFKLLDLIFHISTKKK